MKRRTLKKHARREERRRYTLEQRAKGHHLRCSAIIITGIYTCVLPTVFMIGEPPPEASCPKCFHPHLDYDDEPCVSCGCEYTKNALILTREQIAKAVQTLEDNNIPPATCTICGEGFYMLVKGSVQELTQKDFVCDDCKLHGVTL